MEGAQVPAEDLITAKDRGYTHLMKNETRFIVRQLNRSDFKCCLVITSLKSFYELGMHRSDRRRSISADIPIIGFDRRSQNGRSNLVRSDDIKSARTIRDVSISAHRNGDNAPGEGRRGQRSTRGSSRTERRPRPKCFKKSVISLMFEVLYICISS